MFCFADATGETLSALLRPGNAGSNAVVDHITMLDGAIGQLPENIASGHRFGEDAGLVKRKVIVRADSAGCTEGFLSACRARNVGFFVSARSNAQVPAAIFDAIGIEEVWLPALTQEGAVSSDHRNRWTVRWDHAGAQIGRRESATRAFCGGRRLSSAATAARTSGEWTLRLVPFGKYWRNRPSVFSFEGRCHGLAGSQK
jgi:hypothetical protein